MAKEKQSILRKLLGFMPYLYPKLALAVTFAVLGFLVTVGIPYLILQGALALLRQEALNLWLHGFILVAFGVLRGLFRYGEHYFGHYIAFRVLADFRRLVFQKLRRLAPAKLDRQNKGALLKMIGEDIEALEVFFAHTLPPVLTASFVTFIMVLYLASVSWVLALIALVTYISLALVIPYYFARYLDPLLKSQRQTRTTYMTYFLESLKGMKDLLQFNRVDSRFADLSEKSRFVNQKEKEVYEGNSLQTAATFLVVGLAIFLAAIHNLSALSANHISLDAALASLVVFTTSFAPFLELSRLPLGFKRAVQAGSTIFDLLEEAEPANSGADQALEMDTIQVENLSFAYPHREVLVLSNQSLTFENSQIIGIVGESGSGKSTLMKLLMRWYDPSAGRIRIGNQYLEMVKRERVQEAFAYIPQVPQVFSQTIRENLTLGRDIPDQKILEVAQKCRIKDKILATPQGLDTLINAEQVIFSSGELQRLELTRALLKEAACYIFDEPTAYLDSLNEASFLRLIKEEVPGLIFLISHRPSTVACADSLYRVEKGQFVKER